MCNESSRSVATNAINMARIQLPNGCSCTTPVIYPTNWETSKASLDDYWQIRYRFYDPLCSSKFPEGKQVRITGIQDTTITARRKSVKDLLRNELEKLQRFFYNPITDTYSVPEISEFEIPPATSFPIALEKAKDRLTCSPRMKTIITNCLKHIKAGIKTLQYDHLPIAEIRRRHVRLVLDQVGRSRKGWTASNFNHYRSYMKMLFDVLEEMEATEFDPVSKIKRMKEVRRIRQVLTADERQLVTKHLREKHYTFYRFIQMFFHSGARLSEMVRIRKTDVDLKKQRVKITLRKGKQAMEVYKTIKDIALPFWTEIMIEPGEVLFSKGLRPGAIEINPWQITKRWRDHVKAAPAKTGKLKKNGQLSKNRRPGGLGINADLYSLKHSHSTEVVEALSIREAAEHNSHTNDTMVARVYDIRSVERKHDRVKTLNNPL